MRSLRVVTVGLVGALVLAMGGAPTAAADAGPDVPTLLSPDDGAVVVTRPGLEAMYHHPDDVGGQLEYDVDRWDGSSWVDTHDVTFDAYRSGETVSYRVQNRPGEYRWRVRGVQGENRSAWTVWWAVTYDAPYPPDMPSGLAPDHGALYDATRAEATPTFLATYTHEDGTAGHIEFEVERSSEHGWIHVGGLGTYDVAAADGEEVSWTPGLTETGDHRWRARARDENSRLTAYTPWRAFTFDPDGEQRPAPPTDVASTTHEVGEANTDPTLSMRWTAPAGDDIVGYSHVLGTSSDPDVVDAGVDTSETTWRSGGRGANTYWFHIRSVSANGFASAPVTVGPYEVVHPVDPPPDTSILGGPVGVVAVNTASFELTATEVARFDCNLDGRGWVRCGRELSLGGLWDGEHHLLVRSTDSAGNTDPTPAERSWTVDTTPPSLDVTSAPTGSTTSSSAEVRFVATGAERTDCSVDGVPVRSCRSPLRFEGLDRGAHEVTITATDGVGNATTTIVSWTVRYPTFRDDDASVFQSDIERLAAAGITRGCNPPVSDEFCPDAVVTRGQMAAFLTRALGLPAASGVDFLDDDTSIFEADIERLAAAGVTRGCNPPRNDAFCPGGVVTRGQMAAFLVRALGLPDGSGRTFDDTRSHLFAREVAALAAAGVTRGCNPPTNDRFCPDAPVTRGQMAAFLVRAGLAG